MSDIPAIAARVGVRRRAARWPFLARYLRRLLSTVACGEITIVLPNGETLHHRTAERGPSAKLVIRRWRALWRLIMGGELALAEAFIDGDWWTPNLPAFLEFGARNEAYLQGAISTSRWRRLLGRVRHWRRSNTRSGSRRNIAAHYDLGNAFYERWLDPGMSYSSALFTDRDQSLEAAQENKLNRVLELLEIHGGERVLEIGCGWGAVIERLAPCCDVTGITLSAEQLRYARERIAGKDAERHAHLRLQDYRDVQDTYDRIVSIEMIEAVGERYWPAYFAKLREAVKSNGTVVLQAITIAEDRFARYRDQPDFIQRYIFPGGMLPTVEKIRDHAVRAGLRLIGQQSFGESYARTLAAWRERFLASWPAIGQIGFDARFRRMWEYYLCYCEAGFRTGAIDVGFYKFRPA
jgi:cyclopropane-fatty-acyl-phospholipid synthase